MKCECMNIKNENSASYAGLHMYLLDQSEELKMKKRPCVIVCPGGGYAHTSDREAETVALQFAAMGYHAAVLRYSVTPDAVYPTALREVAASVACVREHAEEWDVDADAIAVCGFSAGGHLTACLGTMWHEAWLSESIGKTTEAIRPNMMILGYPVITSDECSSHSQSYKNLLGDAVEEKKGELSLEKRVSEQTPPTFIWGTFEDELVPVKNSLFFVTALATYKVPTEYHMFERGPHGLSLANRTTDSPWVDCKDPVAAKWIQFVHMWMERHLSER